MRPVVLFTDFGLVDPYVGQMKGVLQQGAPGAPVIDLFHGVVPFRPDYGAWMLERLAPHMPENAVWLCVVDPGVGGGRRNVLVQAKGSSFLGPDNGLLTPIVASGGEVLELTREPPPGSPATFFGRDIFAPVGSALAAGADWTEMGRPCNDPLLTDFTGWAETPGGLTTEIVHVDHYGNLITALPEEALAGRTYHGTLRDRDVGRLVTTFASVGVGEGALVVGGFGTLEVVVNQGSAVRKYEAGPGDRVILTRLKKGGERA